MMKKRTMMLLVAVVATVTSLMAQPKNQRQNLTAEQQVQMKAVRDQYASKLKEIKDEMRQKSVEQKVLLSSKVIDETAVYATVDALSGLKVALHNEMSAMHTAMTEVCPNAGKRPGKEMHASKGPGNSNNKQGVNQGRGAGSQGQGQDMRQGKGSRSQGQGLQNANAQRKNGEGQMAQGRGNGQHQQGVKGQGTRGYENFHKKGVINGAGQGSMLGENCKLSDEQKATMKAVNEKHFWGIQETQNELALLKVKNTTLEECQASFAEVNGLQTKLAKQKMAFKLEVISNLTEEQRMAMLSHRGRQGHNKPSQRSGKMQQNRLII